MENIKDPILQIKDVCISYTSDVMAVKHVSADIEKNTITAIMGPSGCGKSTLLRAVNRGHHGAFWMWKEYVAACREPHA